MTTDNVSITIQDVEVVMATHPQVSQLLRVAAVARIETEKVQAAINKGKKKK